ncbi:phosphoribosyltransferase family protein [Shewanella sp. UCD-KL21]|uniref:phosphoribosyltransferase family protein n=1 Tax=Shewanella sp. UCD-KL21 TaxID=1917164 RepID=UPI000970E8BC|nr:phosphoribosyltransferase family protein [Shewanella sp. UCD-KL21]
MNYKSFCDLSDDIKNNIHKINQQDFDLIVGIPRSGMVPAYMVALLLNANCIDLPAFIRNDKLGKGITRDAKKALNFPHEASNILIVDDSILTGGSMIDALAKIPSNFQGKVTTAAIYTTALVSDKVDIFFEHVDFPRVFEWNLFHHPIVTEACVDIDGVLCQDPTEEQNDDGEKYIQFLAEATPRFIPTMKVDVLITNRLEKFRPHTEQWLAKHGVNYNKLEMLDLPSKAARRAQVDYFAHKADYFKRSPNVLFIESDYQQAIEIANRSNKFVYCVDTNQMIAPTGLKRFKNKKYLGETIRMQFSKIKPLRAIYKKVKSLARA